MAGRHKTTVLRKAMEGCPPGRAEKLKGREK